MHARRHALKLVADKDSLKKIFGPLAERYANRPGGYTRVIKLGHRLGDDAPMVLIELVDREDESPIKPSGKEKKKVDEVTKKKVAGEKTKKTKKDAKESITKATGEKSDGEKKKIAQTKKKPVDKKEKSAKKDKNPSVDSTTKK